MIPYNSTFEPPAPCVEVTVRHPTAESQVTLSAQLDTGADLSGIPEWIVAELELIAARSVPIEGYDGVRAQVPTYIVVLEVAGVRFRQLEVVSLPGRHALLGRDLLNMFYTRLHGPELAFDVGLTLAE